MNLRIQEEFMRQHGNPFIQQDMHWQPAPAHAPTWKARHQAEDLAYAKAMRHRLPTAAWRLGDGRWRPTPVCAGHRAS